MAIDPGDSLIPIELKNAVSRPASDDTTVRSLLEWFGAERRLPKTVSIIRDALSQLGVATEPDFEFAYLDSPIRFSKTHSGTEGVLSEAESPSVQIATVTEPWADPTYRIGKLLAANKAPLSVRPDTTLSEAITLMLQFDYSQLPVMIGERTLKGVVSWKSIASRLSLGKVATTMSEVLEVAPEVKPDESLFESLPIINRYGYVLIRGVDMSVKGIVTSTDVSNQFRTLTEPFILIGEIENYVRRILDGKFTAAELATFVDPKRKSVAESINRVSDLSFGEYIRMLEDVNNWQRLDVNLDRTVFVKRLDDIRRIRNDVMHFDPDGIGSSDLETLRTFVGLLQSLAVIGIIKRGT